MKLSLVCALCSSPRRDFPSRSRLPCLRWIHRHLIIITVENLWSFFTRSPSYELKTDRILSPINLHMWQSCGRKQISSRCFLFRGPQQRKFSLTHSWYRTNDNMFAISKTFLCFSVGAAYVQRWRWFKSCYFIRRAKRSERKTFQATLSKEIFSKVPRRARLSISRDNKLPIYFSLNNLSKWTPVTDFLPT